MRIEIIGHCYASVHPHFAAALAYQLSSLILYRPTKCDVTVTVCMIDDHSDPATEKVLNFFSSRIAPSSLSWLFFDHGRLGRRCIGRNVAAKSSTSDIIWFVDIDYFFRDGCLDRLAEMDWPADAAMLYPRQVRISRDHATGDAALAKMSNRLQVLDVDPTEFVDQKYRKAIGGAQIVRGDFARQHGYLDGDPRWQKPSERMLPDTNDDMAYRRFCSQYGRICGVELPWAYRLRHTVSSYRSGP